MYQYSNNGQMNQFPPQMNNQNNFQMNQNQYNNQMNINNNNIPKNQMQNNNNQYQGNFGQNQMNKILSSSSFNGDMSYINTIIISLSCLSCIKKWYNDYCNIFLSNTVPSLTKSFFQVLQSLYKANNSDSSNLIVSFNNKRPSLGNQNNYNDPYHFLKDFLDLIHLETNMKDERTDPNLIMNQLRQFRNDEKYCYSKFSDYLNKTQNSIVSNCFYNIEEVISECSRCNPEYKFSHNTILTFDIYMYKQLRDGLYINKKFKDLELEDCTEFYVRPNRAICSYCGRTDLNKYTKILSTSKVLIFFFKRYINNSYNYTDISNDISFKLKIPFLKNKYNLISCVSFSGSQNAKFICFLLIKNNWYLFNDGQFIKENNIQMNIKKFRPDILIYELDEQPSNNNIINSRNNINNSMNNNMNINMNINLHNNMNNNNINLNNMGNNMNVMNNNNFPGGVPMNNNNIANNMYMNNNIFRNNVSINNNNTFPGGVPMNNNNFPGGIPMNNNNFPSGVPMNNINIANNMCMNNNTFPNNVTINNNHTFPGGVPMNNNNFPNNVPINNCNPIFNNNNFGNNMTINNINNNPQMMNIPPMGANFVPQFQCINNMGIMQNNGVGVHQPNQQMNMENQNMGQPNTLKNDGGGNAYNSNLNIPFLLIPKNWDHNEKDIIKICPQVISEDTIVELIKNFYIKLDKPRKSIVEFKFKGKKLDITSEQKLKDAGFVNDSKVYAIKHDNFDNMKNPPNKH